MKLEKFREHQIIRTCTEQYDDYHQYKEALMKDFNRRCCYCNICQETITTHFHIDHYIPRAAFKDKREELDCCYDNLILACPKCNLAKSNQYQGDITNPEINNELFYNPDKVDFNEVFFRNELGGIDSEDEKGRDMIKRLRLYRPIHNLAWLVEKLNAICDKLDLHIAATDDANEKRDLQAICDRLSHVYRIKENQFKAAYLQK